jgi:anti-anti-sigma factor
MESAPRLTASVQNGVLVLTVTLSEVRGDDTADAMTREALAAVADNATAKKVAVNFSAVRFLSSAGIRPLLRLHKELHPEGGRVVICGMQPAVREVMHATRLVTSSGHTQAPFEEQPTVEAGVASLAGANA